MAEQVLNVAEAAERLRANPQTIRCWLREGWIRDVMAGRTKLGYLIPESEVDQLLTASVAAGGRGE